MHFAYAMQRKGNIMGEISAATIIISVSLMLMGGFAMTRLTKRLHLPNVTAYIVVGVLLGPVCFNVVPQSIIEGTEFVSDISLAFIAFGVGEFFKLSALRRCGAAAAGVTLIEACIVSAVMFLVMYFLLGLDFSLSVVLASLAAATAPASTMMTIRQTRARGGFVDTLLQVMAFDNVIGLIAYSVAISVALAVTAGGFNAAAVLVPIGKNLAAVLLGVMFGALLKLFLGEKRSTDNRLIISVGILFAFCGVCAVLDVSPLLGCMAIGTVYINLTGDGKLFLQLAYFNPPLLLIYFVRSGLNFNFAALTHGGTFNGVPLIVIGLVYFGVRLVTKYAGAFVGSALLRRPPEVRKFLGLALIPQAGVAIGLAALGARSLGGEVGSTLETVIVLASILYEFVGPPLAKLSLALSNSIGGEDVPEAPPPDAAELIDRIKKIREENALTLPPIGAEEKAFTEAAEEQAMSARPGLYRDKFRR